jgi:hypothetical protein
MGLPSPSVLLRVRQLHSLKTPSSGHLPRHAGVHYRAPRNDRLTARQDARILALRPGLRTSGRHGGTLRLRWRAEGLPCRTLRRAWRALGGGWRTSSLHGRALGQRRRAACLRGGTLRRRDWTLCFRHGALRGADRSRCEDRSVVARRPHDHRRVEREIVPDHTLIVIRMTQELDLVNCLSRRGDAEYSSRVGSCG